MECPKCKKEVGENELVCPHCKKVLKLVCPKCNTINKGNVCKKCGFVIISKCHQCGKINPTINMKCSKCGFSTYTSIAISSSNIDEFACLTIEFPNLEEIRSVMGSIKLTEKFKTNLDKLITGFCGEIGTSREILEEIYIIRFNKDESFKDSCINATKAALEILKLIGELNFKLEKAKGMLLECKIAILKRNIYAAAKEYKSGFNIKLIADNKKKLKYLSCLQVITDQSVNEQINDEYDLNTLSSCLVKKQMIMFFELNLKKHLKLKPQKNDDEKKSLSLAKLNDIQEIVVDEIDEREQKLYNSDSINFDDLKCTFEYSNAMDLPVKIMQAFETGTRKIIAIRGKKSYRLSSNDITQVLEGKKLFNNIYRVTCNDEMKFKPYGFFYELLESINNFKLTPKVFEKNNFSAYKNIDESGFIKSLINLEEREFPHPEDVRFSLFDIFLSIFESFQNTLIYVDNIEKIDDTSFEILQLILEKFESMSITLIVTAEKDFLLHKKCHFLLNSSYYTELRLKPLSLKDMVEKNPQRYSELAESNYFIPILQGARGSYLFFKNAIDYLTEQELIQIKKGQLLVKSGKNVLIPQKFTDLMVKRLIFLQQDETAFKLFSRLILFGPMFDISVVQYLGVENGPQGLKTLSSKDYLFALRNVLYIPEYELMKKAFDKLVPLEQQQEIAKDILQKLFEPNVKHPVQSRLFRLCNEDKNEFFVWEKLSKVNASMGDFSAYLNCSINLLKLLDEKVIDENSEKTVDEYKLDVYENISNLLYKYTPNEVYNMSKIILKNLENSVNDKKVTNLCNKMLQGCLISGNYSYALELVSKILSRFKNASINPNDEKFDIAYFLISMVKIEVLFSTGKLKDCVESGEEILKILTIDKLASLKPEYLSEKHFKESILDAMTFVGISKIILLHSEEDINLFVDLVKTNVGYVPDYYLYLTSLSKVIKGYKNVEVAEPKEDDKFSKTLYYLIKAFACEDINYEKFANDIYQAKISAKLNKLTQFELICDSLIGYSYLILGKIEKASSIFYNVLETSQNNGLKMASYLAMYFIARLKYSQNDYGVSLGLANNAVIQIERENETGDFLFFLFRILMSKTFACQNDFDSAEACLKNALFISNKYGFNFDSSSLKELTEDKKTQNEVKEQSDTAEIMKNAQNTNE